MTEKIHFHKYQGAGNDFVIIDNRKDEYAFLSSSQIALLCDRRYGVGADGLMALHLDSEYGLRMMYYNSDGKEGTMCGNGGRCFTAFARRMNIIENDISFVASDGLHQGEILSSLDDKFLVKLGMRGVGCYRRTTKNVFLLDTGSPHYVRFVSDVERIDVQKMGSKIRFAKEFPSGVNVNFVQMKQGDLLVRTFERGVESETFSCGTGVTASAIAYALVMEKKDGPHSVQVFTKGGHLKIQFDIVRTTRTKVPKVDVPTTAIEFVLKTTPKISNVFLEGLAQFVYEGEIYL